MQALGYLRAGFAFLLVSLNTVLHCAVLFLLALVKLLLPGRAARRAFSRLLVLVADSWIACNGLVFATVARTRWRLEGLDALRLDASYLVICNHQCWVDIPVLQRVLTRRIPFLRFFLKQQLIWVPLLGLAWWALDFPFMRRYGREQVERNPSLRGADMRVTRRACEKFRGLRVSVMNFPEGTRFTPAKHDAQGARYTHLLEPKIGGLAFVLGAMGDVLDGIVDVTVVYPGGRPNMIELFSGRVREIELHARILQIEPWMLDGSYESDPDYRARFRAWVEAIWSDKDALIAARMAGSRA